VPAAPQPPSAEEVRLAPRCPDHDVLLVDGRCLKCDRALEPVPGRLLRGALRKNPMARLGAGLVLGLLVGWLFSAPYASRAEKRVADLRALANADRYRPLDEARANARRLDQEAESASSRGFVVTLVIWMVVGGAVVAGWYRVT
jgi:hypothetical protein